MMQFNFPIEFMFDGYNFSVDGNMTVYVTINVLSTQTNLTTYFNVR